MVVGLALGLGLSLPALAAHETAEVGYLDQQRIEDTHPFRQAILQVQHEKRLLDQEFVPAMRGATSHAEQKLLTQRFAHRFAAVQAKCLDPVFALARTAMVEVAWRHHLSTIVDLKLVSIGGINVTAEVVALIVHPHHLDGLVTPQLSPSTIGFVDQQQINLLPSVKKVNERFQQSAQRIEKHTQQQLKLAATQHERQAIIRQAQDAQTIAHHQLLEPMLDRQQQVIATVAARQGLTLVLDRTQILLGGHDVTSAVVEAMR